MKKGNKGDILIAYDKKGGDSVKIGIFDSGLGGLGLLLSAAKAMPNVEFLYYADTDNVPYGEKPRDVIVSLSDRAVEALRERGANAVVVACNTATSAAIIELRKKYESGDRPMPIIGMEPAVKKAIELCHGGRILTAATPLTVRGAKLKSLLERFDPTGRTDTLPLPGLVRLAESGDFEGGYSYILSAIAGASLNIADYSALVLGCTHFNYFKDSFRRILPEGAFIVDGNTGTVNQLMRRIGVAPSAIEGDTVESIMARTVFLASGRVMDAPDMLLKMKKSLSRLDEMEKI